MAQKNRANMLTDIVTNIFNNIINYITGQNAQDRFVNLLDSTPNILSDKDQADGYVGTDVNNEMISEYYNEFISRADMISKLTANEAVGFKFYQINDAASGARIIQVVADSNISLYSIGLDVATGETGTYDINTDVFTPIVVSGTPTLSQVLTAGNTSGANDIQFDATQGLLFANTSRLREGTIDAGLGGTKGIAQICAVGYELKWEAGRLYVMDGNGLFIRQSLYNFTTTPTATDDTTKGYMVGSLWTLDDGTVYVCTDSTATAAVWVNKGNAYIVEITSTDLAALETAGALSLTTIYIITDATPYKLMCKAETVSQLSKTATIIDKNYSGQVYYDLQINTWSNGVIYDVNNNIWNGCLPTNVVLGADCSNNTFNQASNSFTFGDNLRNVTIDAGVTGADYSNDLTYSFLYNNVYASTIFQSGGVNYHRYFAPANDKIVVTNLATLVETSIGGSSGDVVGPASAVDNNIATFDGTTGKLIQDGGTTIADINTNAVDRITVKLAESINKGQAVYISGANGTNILVSKADNTTEATSSKTLGLLETTGATNAIVNVITSGLIDGINTSAATIGDAVWLGTAGNLLFGLANKPYAPAHLVYIGVVSRVSATVGEIIVKIQNGFELKEIHDVSAQTPANKNGLFYNTSTSLWEARAVAATDIDANVSNTEFGYLDGVTSSIQTQINAIKKPISSVGNGTAVTGVVVNTYSKGLLIPANSRVAGDVPQIDCQVTKTGSAGNIQLRFYWNTTNDLAGSPILIGTSVNGAANWSAMSRLMSIEVAAGTGNGTKVAPTTVVLATGWGTATAAPNALSIDWTANGYLICAILNSNAGDSSVCHMLKLN